MPDSAPPLPAGASFVDDPPLPDGAAFVDSSSAPVRSFTDRLADYQLQPATMLPQVLARPGQQPIPSPVDNPLNRPAPSLGPPPVQAGDPIAIANRVLAQQHAGEVGYRLPAQPVPATIGEQAQQITSPRKVEAYTPPAPAVGAPPTPADLAAAQMAKPVPGGVAGFLEHPIDTTLNAAENVPAQLLRHLVLTPEEADAGLSARNPLPAGFAGNSPDAILARARTRQLNRTAGMDDQELRDTLSRPVLQITQTKAFQDALDPFSNNPFSRAVTGIAKTGEGLTTPSNLALLYAMPGGSLGRLASVYFGLQAGGASAHEAYEALKSAHKGEIGDFSEESVQTLMNLTLAALATHHATHGIAGKVMNAMSPAAWQRIPEFPEGDQPEAPDVTPREDPTRTFTAPANAGLQNVTPGGVEPPTKDLVALAGEATNQPQPVGDVHPPSGRDVLQPTDNPVHLDRAAQRAAPELEQRLAAAVRGVPDAEVEGVRERKDPQRLVEKLTTEGKPAHTIPDYLAGRVVVDTPVAHDAVVTALRRQFPVVREEDTFKDGDDQYGYRTHTLQVQLSNGITAEVQVVPKEIAEANPDQHEDYERAREAEMAGNKEAAKSAAEEAKAKNDAAMEKFNQRNGVPEKEPKYKFGSTQANLPASSDAAKAIGDMQSRIPDQDLAGDGKDIDKPHVTVRYGLKNGITPELRKFIESQKPFEAKLGTTTSFPPSANSDGAAPIIAPVESPELHRLNREIESRGEFEPSSFPDYRPHVTVAFVRPELAERYTGLTDAKGKTFLIDSIAISDRDGKHTEIPLLGGESNSERKGGRGESPEPAKGGDTTSPPLQPTVGETVELYGHAGVPDGTKARVEQWNPRGRLAKDATGTRLVGAGRVSIEQPDGSRKHVLNVLQSEVQLPANLPTATPKDTTEGEDAWIGVDLDGTLAHYDGWKGKENVGKPVAPMVERVKQWLGEGKNVKIFTARVADDPGGVARAAIDRWSEEHLGQKLPITNVKDEKMSELWDDRAVQVGRNTGHPLGNPEEAGNHGKTGAAGRDTGGDRTRPGAAAEPAPAGGDRGVEAAAATPETSGGAVNVPAAAKADIREGSQDAVREPGAAGVLPHQSGEKEGGAAGGGGVRRGEQGAEEPAEVRRGPDAGGAGEAKAEDLAKLDTNPKKKNTAQELAADLRAKGKDVRTGVELTDDERRADLEAQGQKPMFAAPTWYLKSERLIDQKMKGPMLGSQVLRMLENGGVKADELKWTGLQEFLEGKKLVRPEEVKQHLAEGGIQVEDVPYGVDDDRLEELREMETRTPSEEAEFRRYVNQQRGGPKTKFGAYVLPGGANYREILLTLPPTLKELEQWKAVYPSGLTLGIYDSEANAQRAADEVDGSVQRARNVRVEGNFKSRHWDEPNVLAHIRFNDRTTPDGQRLLHIEEIQSDWHQKGRDKGYKQSNPLAQEAFEAVPDAPFKKDWHEMAFRRAVRYAAENGYDGVSWTPGEKQAERYSLAKQIDQLSYDPRTQRLEATLPNGANHIDRVVPPEDLGDYVGKEVARKLLDSPLRKRVDDAKFNDALINPAPGGRFEISRGNGTYEGPFETREAAQAVIDRGHASVHVLDKPDLKVGGEGMKGFYDKIIPDYARKFGKQWGAKVGETEIAIGNDGKFVEDGAGGTVRMGGKPVTTTVPYLDITPEMRRSVVEQGVPLFRRRGEEADAGIDRGRFLGVPAEGENAPMVQIDRSIRDGLNDLEPDLAEGGKWPAVSIPKSLTDKLVDKLRLKAKQLASQGAQSIADHWNRLADTLDNSRDATGNTILVTPEGQESIPEEQFHGWGHRWGTEVGDVVLQVGQHPAALKARAYLQKLGYAGDVPTAVLEATAKTFNGDWAGAGLTQAEGASLLTEFLHAVVKVRGPEALDDAPKAADEITDLLERAREAYGRQSEFPDREPGGAAAGAGDGVRTVSDEPKGGVDRQDLQRGPVDRPAGETDRGGTQRSLFGRVKGEDRRTADEWRKYDQEQLDALEALVEQMEDKEDVRPIEREGLDALVKDLEKRYDGKPLEHRLLERAQELRRRSIAEETKKRGKEGLAYVRAQARKPVGEPPDPQTALRRLRERLTALPEQKRTLSQRLKAQVTAAGKNWSDDTRKAVETLRHAQERIEDGWANLRAKKVPVDPEAKSKNGYRDAYGLYEERKTRRALEHEKFAEELRRVAPDKSTRVAITDYIQAGGDMEVLKYREAHSKPEYKQGYADAQKLTPDQKVIADTIRRYNDENEKAEIAAGFIEQGKINYMRQSYQGRDKSGFDALINYAILRDDPSIFKHSAFRNYFEAESAGYAPKDKDAGVLTAEYDRQMGEAVDGRALLADLLHRRQTDGRPSAILRRDGMVMQIGPEDQPYLMQYDHVDDGSDPDRRDYEHLPVPIMKGWLWEAGQIDENELSKKDILLLRTATAIAMRGDVYLHPEAFKPLKNLFEKSAIRATPVGKFVLGASQLVKDAMFTFSATHQTIISTTGALEGHGPINLDNVKKTATLKGWANPFSKDDTLLDLDAGPDSAIKIRLVRNGLTLMNLASEEAWSDAASSGAAKYLPVVGNWMLDYKNLLFRDIIPKYKMQSAIDRYKANAKTYLGKKSLDEIAELTASQVNSLYGGINWQRLGVSKTLVDLSRLLLLAPDFQYGRVTSALQALKPGGRQQLIFFVRSAVVMYTLARVINALANDGDMKTDIDDAFRLVVNGKHYGIRTPIGDMYELVTDPWLYTYRRLNPLFSKDLLELARHKDEFGRAKSNIGVLKDALTNALPISLSGAFKNQDLDYQQTFLGSLGIQSGKYYTPAETMAHKLRIGHIPDSTEEEEDLSREHRKLKEGLREGKLSSTDVWNAVGDDFTPAQARRVIDLANETQLQEDVKALPISEALDVYAKASPMEQEDLEPILNKKRQEWDADKRVTPSQREKLEPKIEETLAVR